MSGTPRDVLLAGAAALAFALAAYALGVPGGLVVGGATGAALVALLRDRAIRPPSAAVTAIQVAIGVTVGTRVDPGTLPALRDSIVPAVMTTLLLVVVGLLTARILHRHTAAPSWIVLATCPGGLEALVSVALARDEGPAEVALFHLVRLVLVIASVPLLLTFL